jgi:hypothetical protein
VQRLKQQPQHLIAAAVAAREAFDLLILDNVGLLQPLGIKLHVDPQLPPQAIDRMVELDFYPVDADSPLELLADRLGVFIDSRSVLSGGGFVTDNPGKLLTT